MSLAQRGYGASPISRWVSGRVWRLEHAFERARASGKAEDDTRLRIFFVLVLFAVGLLTLAIGATRAALFSDVRVVGTLAPAAGARAELVDRNGKILAADLLHYGVYVDPREVWDPAEVRAGLVSALPDLAPARLERALRASWRTFLVGALTPEARNRVHQLGLPGISFEPEYRRVYPLDYTAAHIIGFTDSGGEGLAGAELALNEDIHAASASGAATALSIDLRIQAALDDEVAKAATKFSAKGAVGIVLNVHSGEILGMTSWPALDPNRAGEASDEARLNRAAAQVFEMGSTFKAFTVAMGLDTGVATPETTYDAREPFRVGYRTIRDYHAARAILNLVEVFQHSSNIGNARVGLQVGAERMERYFDAFGLTQPAKVELVESARPLTPREWNEDAVVSMSFGHGINVTPLALSRAMAALLNGGTVPTLTIRKLEPGDHRAGPRAVSEETSRQMLQIMRANVTGGSGKSADIPGLNVGGKTGTGEKYDPAIGRYNTKRQVSSFAAAFPTDGPLEEDRYFVLILMDEPHATADTYGYSTGGWVAAPAAGRVIERIAPFLGVKRRAETFPHAPPPKVVALAGDGR